MFSTSTHWSFIRPEDFELLVILHIQQLEPQNDDKLKPHCIIEAADGVHLFHLSEYAVLSSCDSLMYFHFISYFLTLLSESALSFPKPAWSWTWCLEVSVASALLTSDCDSFLEDLSTPWWCCLLVFLTSWSVCAEHRFWSGLSSSSRLGDLFNALLCSASLCCISGGICSGSGVSSSAGGSSTETRLATREEGSTAVTTRVTLKGKGAWKNTKVD